MNNKTLKRVVAFLATALLVCSCAFAATIDDATVTYDATSGEIVVPFAPGTGATKAALLVRNERTDEIVALAQFNSLTNVVAFEETIDTTKVAAGDTLAISVGDNADESTSADTAKYTVPVPVVEYTITFVDEDGETVLQTGKVAKDAMPVAPADPVKAADAQYTYTFAGWTPEIVAATADATYTATYTETVNEYTITWIVDGVETTETYAYGATPEFKGSTDKAADAENTYAFTGWTPEIATVTGNATYTATYEATPIVPEVPAVKVTFVNGAEATEVEAVDGVVALPAAPATIGLTAEESASGLYPTNSVLKFVGWANADDTVLYTANLTEVAENITLYAKFESNFVKGDVTGDGKVNIPDRAQIIPYVTKNGTQAFGNVGKTIHPLIPDVAGDVTNDKKVNIPDRAQIIPYVTKNGAQMFGSVGNKIYFINK